jgi:hypothetical protein
MTTTTRTLTVRLEADDYGRLEREAARLGMRPGTLARVLLRASLGKPEPPSGNPQVSFQHLLERLAALRQTLPSADAAAIVAAGRAELDRRGESDP